MPRDTDSHHVCSLLVYAHKASYSSETQVPWIPRPIEARQVLKSWMETRATRDVRFINAPWSRAYLDLNNVDARLNADDTQTFSRNTTAGYIPWNITTTARNWLASQPNNGILFQQRMIMCLGMKSGFTVVSAPKHLTWKSTVLLT